MSKVRLYFPDIETGQVSVGYSTVDVVDHIAEIDEAEAAVIAYWQQTASATIVSTAQPTAAIDPGINPFDPARRSVGSDPDEDELSIGASK